MRMNFMPVPARANSCFPAASGAPQPAAVVVRHYQGVTFGLCQVGAHPVVQVGPAMLVQVLDEMSQPLAEPAVFILAMTGSVIEDVLAKRDRMREFMGKH